MERRYRIRLDELLIDAEVCTGLLRGSLSSRFAKKLLSWIYAEHLRQR